MENLKFIGIGGATNIELGGNCCYLKNKDSLLVIDACEDATQKLKTLGAFEDINDIYIIITHTHYDHIAGLGVLIWYSNFKLNIRPKIIYGNIRYKYTLKNLLKLTGVNTKYVEFIKDSSFKLNDLILKLQKTTHTEKLQCFGIMFEDRLGKYYYTGDTNDINYIKYLCDNSSIKKIYTEVSTNSFDSHIKYEDITKLDKDKLILMHFDTVELYEKAKNDGFKVASMDKFK